MSKTRVALYREEDGSCPFIEWFDKLPARLKNLEEARANEEIGHKIQELRAAAALTQTQLAKVIGTTAAPPLRTSSHKEPR